MSDYGATEKELVPGALRGYRTWRPYGDRSGGVPLTLRACNFEVTWTPGVNWAICERGNVRGFRAVFENYPPPPDHPAPTKGCSCGFYAVHHPQHVDGRGAVFGSVKAYGSVILGEKGFRAGKVEIEALAPVTSWIGSDAWDILKQLGDQYQVPVFPTFGLLLDAFPPISVEHLLGDWRSEQEQKRQQWVDKAYYKFTAEVADLEARIVESYKTLPPPDTIPPGVNKPPAPRRGRDCAGLGSFKEMIK